MTYENITRHSSPFYAAGNGRKPKSITIHWWDDPARRPTFAGTVAWLTRPGTTASIHWVAEAGKVACLVDPENIAWHAGDGGAGPGNLTSLGIEMNPRQSAGDYATVAELVRDIRKVYGDLPLVPHRHWKNTACPGTVDLARIDREARAGTTKPAPAPAAPAAPAPAGKYVPDPHWVVDPGDTLGKIAAHFGVGISRLATYNGLANPNVIRVGELIWPPTGRDTWTVDPGDTLGKIAHYYGISVDAIANANGINDPNTIRAGVRLQIP